MDEIQRIILEVQNKDKLQDLNAELEKEEKLLQQLVRTNAAFSTAPTVAAMEASAAKVRDLNAQIKDLEKSAGGLRSGGLMQLSYVFDDLVNTTGGWERKLASISNNIPGLVAGLGGSSGIAGAIGLIGTAAVLAAPLVKKLVESFTGAEGFPGVEVVLDDAARKVKDLQSQLDRILNARPYREKESSEAIAFYLGEVGGPQLVRGLGSALGQAGEGAQPADAEKKRLKDLRENVEFTRNNWTIPGTREAAERSLQEAQMEVRERIMRENERLAGEMIAKAPTDSAARRRLRNLAARFPGGLPAHLASELGELEPEALQAQDEAIRKGEEDTAGYRERKAARKRKKREDRRDVDLALSLTWEDDDANRRAFDEGKRRKAQAQARERRATDDELRETGREDSDNKRAFDASKRTRPVRRAAAQVRDVARANGVELSPEQLTEAGRAAVSMASDGLDAQQAAFTAFMEQVEAMRRVQARAQAMQQQWQGAMGYQSQMATGADWGGQFSAMPPMMGGGFGFSG